MKYAVIKTGGKQYRVSENMEIEVDKLQSDTTSDHKFEHVLLYANNGIFQLGQPYISGAIVTARVLEQKKGKKIRVAKFKAKARYRKVQGHRQHLTKLQITKIALVGGKAEKVPEKVKSENSSIRQAQDRKVKNASKKSKV